MVCQEKTQLLFVVLKRANAPQVIRIFNHLIIILQFPSFRLDSTLSAMVNDADSQCAALLKAARAEHSVLVQAVSLAERELEELQKSLTSMRTLGNGLSTFGVHVASKVQDANVQKDQALRADGVLEHLLTFAEVQDFGSLPPLFENEDRVEEAANVLSDLSLALSKAYGEVRQGLIKTNQERNGTLNAIFEQVELYKNVLTNRLVTRFDAAVVDKDVKEMSVCIRAMTALGPENITTLMDRYLSSAPLFKDAQISRLVEEIKLLSFNRDALSLHAADQNAIATLQVLTDLYSALSEAFRAEAVMMEQIFPESANSIALLVHRTFEVLVQPALKEALRVPSDDASHEALHAHLQLLTEAYKKTLAFAEEVTMLAGPQSDLKAEELVKDVCGHALQEYESIEMSWMAGMFNDKVARASQPLSREVMLDMLAVNEEAIKRCVVVTPQAELPAVVAMFFGKAVCSISPPVRPASNWSLYQSSEPEDSQVNVRLSLLDHIESSLINGMESCARANLPKISQSNLQATQPSLTEGESPLSTILLGVSQAVELVILLKAHCDRVIVPHVSSSTTELERCRGGVSSLTQRLEKLISDTLKKILDRLGQIMTSVLGTQQSKLDFNPLKAFASETKADRPNISVTFDEPTLACKSVVSLLRNVVEVVLRHLHGSNRASFLDSLALVTVNAVEMHSLKQTFSVEGGLRWRRDLDEYSQVFTECGARTAQTAFEDLRSLASLLIIGPGGLPGLIETVVRQVGMARVEGLLERREDWKYATVSGRPLSSVLTQF